MIVALLKTRMKTDAPLGEYAALGERMYGLVSAMEGFVSAEFFSGADGTELTIARFTSEAALAAWRNLPEHVDVQKRGMTDFYATLDVEICELVREYTRTSEESAEAKPQPA